MYGMIHRALQQMLVESRGAEAWALLQAEHDVGPDAMIGLQAYDDAVTFQLVAAVAGQMGCSVPMCLEVFGEYWIKYAQAGPFARLLDFTGRNLPEFIANLDRVHQSVAVAIPGSVLPSFRLAEQRDDFLKVEFRSSRIGLEPFVVGFLRGLLNRFGLHGVVRQIDEPGPGMFFAITYRDAIV